MKRENSIFTLGLISLILSTILSPVSIILSIIGLVNVKKASAENGGNLSGKAITGKVFSIIGLIAGIIFTLVYIFTVSAIVLMILETNYHF